MRVLPVLAAALSLSACFIEPRDRTPGDRGWDDGALYGSDWSAVRETDAFLSVELARPDRDAPARLDADARALGLGGRSELVAVVSGDCLEPRDLGRFASAGGIGAASAAVYLRRRFGVKACPSAL